VSTTHLIAFTDEHVAPFAETIRDPAILQYTGTPVPTPDGWIEAWRQRFRDEDRANFAIVDNAGGFVGYAVTGPIDRVGATAELGYAISPWARGRGHATEALQLLTDWAFADGIIRATLLIAVSNTASSRVAEKCGYTLEGVLRSVHQKNGRREDMQSWSRLPTD
jgi:RimJ/RimL family protein N-acetyltransferase